MNTTTPPPTPETGEGSPSLANFTIQKFERELNEAREQINAMREVIEDVNKILLLIQRNDIFEETLRTHATCAIAKLQPFLP
jgi:hypothetical protein